MSEPLFSHKGKATYVTAPMLRPIFVPTRTLSVNVDRVTPFGPAFHLHFQRPRKRNYWWHPVTPTECNPPFCFVLAGHVEIELPACRVHPSGLAYRPGEWPIVRNYLDDVSMIITEQCELLFDWRMHIGGDQ